jgi:uncharacterized phosphosugar-binding protein
MNYQYPRIARETLDHIESTQLGAIDEAVQLFSAAISNGGVVHVFGTGHARIPMHEMAGRAGGLMAINLVRISDLVQWGDADPASIRDPTLERDRTLAAPLLELAGARPGDAFLIASNSGINGSVVELALLVEQLGLPLVALTSVSHSESVPSRHPSGKRLMDVADVVIDSGAPAGDAALTLDDGTRVGAVSNLAGVFVAQLLTEGIARSIIAAGEHPPVYMSMNLPEGDQANAELEAKYRERVRPIEP